ncbi:hypothetical protein BC826DRAFT_908766 [Russula brevipes]|nr:hypothetical protein BC826DRAFT_908766 [Russula brevipes]
MHGNLDPIVSGAERAVVVLVGLIASGKVRPLLFRVGASLCPVRCDGPIAPPLLHVAFDRSRAYALVTNSPPTLSTAHTHTHTQSTFAEALQTFAPQIRRCNQDELGSRRAVEDVSRTCLRQGLSVCIDRTNVDSAQRSHWIRIAREFPDTAVWVIFFDTPYDVCAARLRSRQNHPTITNADHGMQILSRFASTFEPPLPGEGYDKLIALTLEDQPSAGYSRPDILAILKRLRDSPSVRDSTHGTQSTIRSPWNQMDNASSYSRGGDRSGSRGRKRRALPQENTNKYRNWDRSA